MIMIQNNSNVDEVWKPVKGFYGFAVSNKGNVKALERSITYENGKIVHRKEKLLSQHVINSGYKIVDFTINGIHKRKLVHILVAEAFINNPANYTQINHKDKNKLNNNVENLEWCNGVYNKNYSDVFNKGAIAVSKKVRAFTKNNEFNKIYKSVAECAKDFECRPSTIRYRIINNICTYNKIFFEYFNED